jgi:hypothetical protein
MPVSIIDADPARLLNETFWYSKLPDGTALHPKSAAIVAEIVKQSTLLQPVDNDATWTSELLIVPKDQPLIPGACNHDSIMHAIAANGLPVPPDAAPTADSDSALIVYQPDAPNDGYMWELQGFRWVTPGVQWACNSLSRMSAVNTRSNGHFVTWTASGVDWRNPGHTYSTYELGSWGIQGSGLPYAPGVLSMADIRRGYVNHALLLEVYDAAAGGHVWPAARGDGGAGRSNEDAVLCEGMWLRLPAGYVIPAGLDPITSLYVQAARDFGILITDRTLSCLAVRAMPSCAAAIGSDNHLINFPWSDLQCTVPGNDTTWHPLA